MELQEVFRTKKKKKRKKERKMIPTNCLEQQEGRMDKRGCNPCPGPEAQLVQQVSCQ
jgi:hypothetical protein